MHKRLILACVLLGILFGWLAIVFWPRSYESAAKLMVKVGRENVSLDPTATTGSDLMMPQKLQEEEVATALEVLNSRKVAEHVVDVLGVEAVLNGELPKPEGESQASPDVMTLSGRLESWKATCDQWLYQFLLRAGVKDNVSDREMAVRAIQQSIQISTPKKSSVVVVEGVSATPEMAQAIVKEVTDSFLDEHLRARTPRVRSSSLMGKQRMSRKR